MRGRRSDGGRVTVGGRDAGRLLGQWSRRAAAAGHARYAAGVGGGGRGAMIEAGGEGQLVEGGGSGRVAWGGWRRVPRVRAEE